jgi:hypothetical protein
MKKLSRVVPVATRQVAAASTNQRRWGSDTTGGDAHMVPKSGQVMHSYWLIQKLREIRGSPNSFL